MVSTIKKNNPLLIFEGYLNKSETSKKVIHNVFRKNDSAFLTGLCSNLIKIYFATFFRRYFTLGSIGLCLF